MERKPVIFLSSTYLDLKQARAMVIGHLIKNQYLFSGMEGFFMLPMMEQWENIKRTIDDCDVYVAILGDRFGSLAHAGRSCTELECEYATQIGKPVIALIQEKKKVALFKGKQSSINREKQRIFREKIACDYRYTWKTHEELIDKIFKGIFEIEKKNSIIGYGRPLVRETNFTETPNGFRVKLEYSDNTTDWNKKKFVYEEVIYYEIDELNKTIKALSNEKRVNLETAVYLYLRRKVIEKFFDKDIVINGFFVNDHDIENALRQIEKGSYI